MNHSHNVWFQTCASSCLSPLFDMLWLIEVFWHLLEVCHEEQEQMNASLLHSCCTDFSNQPSNVDDEGLSSFQMWIDLKLVVEAERPCDKQCVVKVMLVRLWLSMFCDQSQRDEFCDEMWFLLWLLLMIVEFVKVLRRTIQLWWVNGSHNVLSWWLSSNNCDASLEESECTDKMLVWFCPTMEIQKLCHHWWPVPICGSSLAGEPQW